MNKTTAKGVLTDLLYAYAEDEYGDYFYEHGDVVCEAVECIMREQPQWISVEERLPEREQMVLVYCRSQMYKKHITVSTYTADYSYTRRCYWSRRIKNVTHWMPLPEPPTEEEV